MLMGASRVGDGFPALDFCGGEVVVKEIGGWADTQKSWDKVDIPAPHLHLYEKDSETSGHSPCPPTIPACPSREYEVRPVPWSQRESVREELAA